MLSPSGVPCDTDARPELIEVRGPPLWDRGFLRSRPQRSYANEHRISHQRRLRLGVPGAIPTQTIGDRDTGSDRPLVLPVQTQITLIIGEERSSWTQSGERQIIQRH